MKDRLEISNTNFKVTFCSYFLIRVEVINIDFKCSTFRRNHRPSLENVIYVLTHFTKSKDLKISRLKNAPMLPQHALSERLERFTS